MIRRAGIGLVLVVAVVVALAVWIASDSGTSPESATQPDSPADPNQPARSTDRDPQSETEVDSDGPLVVAVQAPAGAQQATMTRLADGDSFDIVWASSGEFDEVRLVGINAPERDACFGSHARDVLAGLLDDQVLLVDWVERDEFGRVLADVWAGDVFVNVAMVERGAALAISGDGSHAALIADAQGIAEAEGRGLWSADECGVAQTELTIADIEFNPRGPDDQNQNEEWIEITNGRSDPASLDGYSIRDESTRNRFAFPSDFVLQAGRTVRVRSGCGVDDETDLYWCAQSPIWNNGGDTGFLVNPEGQFVDTYAYSG